MERGLDLNEMIFCGENNLAVNVYTHFAIIFAVFYAFNFVKIVTKAQYKGTLNAVWLSYCLLV